MSIKKDILMRVLKKIILDEARANEDLLRSNPILQHLTRTQVKRLANKSKEFNTIRNQYIF